MTIDLRTLLAQGVEQRAFTRASVAVYRSGQPVLRDATHDNGDVFDVASLTKIATAALALKQFDPEARLSLAGTVRDLLAHRTGLPAWRPFFGAASLLLGASVPKMIATPELQAEAKRITRLYLSVIEAGPQRTIYSDLNFLMLGFALETLTGQSLSTLGNDALFRPLKLESMRWGGEQANAIPTGSGRPRPGNPAFGSPESPPAEPPPPKSDERKLVEALERFERLPPPPIPTYPSASDRAVDDDNAACMGGTTGHAGLWSNATDMAHLGDALRQCSEGKSDQPLNVEKARLLFARAGGGRTYGLDLPGGENPAIGTILGKGPKGAAGHLGFTGCSLWIDRDAELSIALLTDAVSIERPNPRIREFRPVLHDAIAREFVPAK